MARTKLPNGTIDGKYSIWRARSFSRMRMVIRGVCYTTYPRSLKSEVEAAHLHRFKYTVVFYCLCRDSSIDGGYRYAIVPDKKITSLTIVFSEPFLEYLQCPLLRPARVFLHYTLSALSILNDPKDVSNREALARLSSRGTSTEHIINSSPISTQGPQRTKNHMLAPRPVAANR